MRRIWGNGDTILFIFAGSAAEFALNKAVDWLYYTGRLPSDPLGRLFSTVSYARQIVFAEKAVAEKAIDTIAGIHAGLEAKRGAKIPDWAYRDVLFMLIGYSIRAYELVERPLLKAEQEEVFSVFLRVGQRMGIAGLPTSLPEWEQMRKEHLQQDLEKGAYTTDLYQQYRKHLGWLRYRLLLETQMLVVPEEVRELLGIRRPSAVGPALGLYKVSRKVKLDWFLKSLLLPSEYKEQIRALDQPPA